MNKKRFLSMLIVLAALFLCIGCEKDAVRETWDNYVNAVNEKDLNAVSTYFALTDANRKTFVEENENYFDSLSSLETISFEVIGTSDVSSTVYREVYYLVDVKCKVNGAAEISFNAYMREENAGIIFCSALNLTDSSKEYGNSPDTLWTNKMYYTTDQYKYKIIESTTQYAALKLDMDEINDNIEGIILGSSYNQESMLLSISSVITSSQTMKAKLVDTTNIDKLISEINDFKTFVSANATATGEDLKAAFAEANIAFATIDSVVKTVTYLESVSNDKKIEIPSVIDGMYVNKILKFAFYKSTKILSFSIAQSKLEELVIPNTIEEIGENAFYQCIKLTKLSIPASVKTISSKAFANCRNIKTLTFEVTSNYSSISLDEVASTGAFTITGGHNMLVGDIVSLDCDRNSVTWSVGENNSTLCSIDADTGTLTATGKGNITITATDKTNGDKATLALTISECTVALTISVDAFNRLNKLQSLYIYAANPNSINLSGNSLNLNSTVRIYVPTGYAEMYKSHVSWSKYSSQIYEFDV